MLLSILSEVTWEFYASGRQKSTNRSFSKKDVKQFLKMCAGGILRSRFYSSLQKTGEVDLSIMSPLLSIQIFDLGEPNEVGMRSADMSDFDLFRLPNSSHIESVLPLGCAGTESKAIPIFSPGEEYFYSTPKFKSLKFGVVKGRQIKTYHLPPCVKKLSVESTYADGDDIDPDISLDVAFEASNETLGRMIGIPDFINKGSDNPYTLPQKNLKQRINQQPQPQPE
jgi:hypothetical protein